MKFEDMTPEQRAILDRIDRMEEERRRDNIRWLLKWLAVIVVIGLALGWLLNR